MVSRHARAWLLGSAALASCLVLAPLVPASAEVIATPPPAPKKAVAKPGAAKSGAAKRGAAKAAATGPLNLEAIVVTGTARRVSKMKSSVSVSTLSATQIQESGAQSTADVLRQIPGFRSEASGGDSNANVTARGLPVSAGGSRYIQFQQDGLPVLDFGDIAFATPDSFLRIDGLLDQIQAVRGGSSSTEATNAPGGIINFLSKTGVDQGGNVSFSSGLGYDLYRVDGDYGAPIDDVNRFEVAGFYHNGSGVRDSQGSVYNGGQIHGNFTHEIDNGFLRLNFGFLDDDTPTLLPVPRLPGIDPRYASFYSRNLGDDPSLRVNNSVETTNITTGNTVEQGLIGFEARKTIQGFTVDDKFRFEANSGTFLGLYPGGNVFSNGSLTYLNGPQAGQPYSGRAIDLLTFDTHLNNLNNIGNDLKLSTPVLDAGRFGHFTPVVGMWIGQQNLDLNWDFNNYYATAVGSGTQFLHGTGPDGTTAANGLVNGIGGGDGRCCQRYYDTTYLTTSPYVDIGWAINKFTSDASVREDIQQASGRVNFSPVNNNTPYYDPNGFQSVNYSVNHTSYSFGTNYEFNRNLATFFRYSNGVSFNADRILVPGTPIPGTNDVPVPINVVRQYEGGVKFRVENFSGFVTLFDAKTDETNYDATTQISDTNSYNAYGVEIEFGYLIGNLRLGGGATYTHARIDTTNETYTDAAGQVVSDSGHVPQRQADWVYQLQASYKWGKLTLGANGVGTTSSYADDNNTYRMPGYVVFNIFGSYDLTQHLQVLVNGNNLFNQIAYTEFDSGGFSGRALDGRSFLGTIRYRF